LDKRLEKETKMEEPVNSSETSRKSKKNLMNLKEHPGEWDNLSHMPSLKDPNGMTISKGYLKENEEYWRQYKIKQVNKKENQSTGKNVTFYSLEKEKKINETLWDY
jgi:hypothetical protein